LVPLQHVIVFSSAVIRASANLLPHEMYPQKNKNKKTTKNKTREKTQARSIFLNMLSHVART